MGQIDWSKAPEGATHAAITNDGGSICWYKDIEEQGYQYQEAPSGIFSGWARNPGKPVNGPLERRPESNPEPEWVPGKTLPPVGVTEDDCELIGFGYKKPRFEVVAHHYNGVTAVVSIVTEGGVEYRPAKSAHFRPIKSHKERVMEAAMAVAAPRGRDGYRDAYGWLYDAGMLKLPEDSQ